MSATEDSYLWLENLEDSKVKEWFSERDEASRKLLKETSTKLKSRIEHYYSLPYALLARTSAKGYFVLIREKGEFKIKLITSDGVKTELVRSSDLGKDVVLKWIYPSNDGDRLAFSYSYGGSDEGLLRLIEIQSGEVLDELKGDLSDIVWLDKHRYFYGKFYRQENTPDGVTPPAMRVFLREDGEDTMVFGEGVQTSHFIGLDQSTGGDKALLTVSYGWMKSDAYAGKLEDHEDWNLIHGKGDFVTWPIDYYNGQYLVASFDKAGLGRILTVEDESKIQEIVREQSYSLQEAVLTEDRLILNYLSDASSILRIHSLKAADVKEIEIQPPGSIDSVDSDGSKCVFKYESYSVPYRIYTLKRDETRILDSSEIKAQLTMENLWTSSEDSTPIHAFRVKKGIENHDRTLAWGYGGFAISITPRFYPHIIPFLEDGGTFIAANLRGGKELGEEWHRKGLREKKQNVFNDFIAILKSLRKGGSRIVGYGVSNGGLLVGAVLTQRPELLDGALIGYPVLDMLRFHKLHIGKAWVPEYGDPENPDDADFLRKYSPYHNVRTTQRYPVTMLYTGLHDDRVHPAHALKFAAKLEETGATCLLRVETKSGHSGATPTTKIEEYADIMAFVYKTLGVSADTS